MDFTNTTYKETKVVKTSVENVYGLSNIDIPLGYTYWAFRPPMVGEYFITVVDHQTIVAKWTSQFRGDPFIIIRPVGLKRYIFEETGEKRRILAGEYYYDPFINGVAKCSANTTSEYVVLKLKEETFNKR